MVGAGSEIGAAIAQALTGSGEPLELWGRDPDRLDLAACRCRVMDPTALIITRTVDLSDPDRVRQAVKGLRDAPPSTAVWTPGLFDWASPVDADPERWAAGLSVDESFRAIRSYARRTNTPIHAVAVGIVDRSLDVVAR